MSKAEKVDARKMSLTWTILIGITFFLIACMTTIYVRWIYPVHQLQAAKKIVENSSPPTLMGGGFTAYSYPLNNITLDTVKPDWIVDFYDNKLNGLLGNSCRQYFDEGYGLYIEDGSRLSEAQLIDVLRKLAVQNSIQEVELVGQSTTDRVVAELARLKKVSYIELRETAVTDKGVIAMATLPDLVSLTLDDAQVTEASFEKIGGCKNLTNLFLNSAVVNKEMMESLQKLKLLENLTLSDCKITDEAMQAIGLIPHLVEVDFSGSEISDEGVVLLSISKSITTLNISGCDNLSYRAIPCLTAMPQFENIYCNE